MLSGVCPLMEAVLKAAYVALRAIDARGDAPRRVTRGGMSAVATTFPTGPQVVPRSLRWEGEAPSSIFIHVIFHSFAYEPL